MITRYPWYHIPKTLKELPCESQSNRNLVLYESGSYHGGSFPTGTINTVIIRSEFCVHRILFSQISSHAMAKFMPLRFNIATGNFMWYVTQMYQYKCIKTSKSCLKRSSNGSNTAMIRINKISLKYITGGKTGGAIVAEWWHHDSGSMVALVYAPMPTLS